MEATERLLCGTGPTNPDPRVLHAMSSPLLGQFDPEFTSIMEDVMASSRQVFQTSNPRTFAVSATGRGGMEAAIASLVEAGDRVLVANCGRFGDLFVDLAARYGGHVSQVTAEWGRVIEPQQIEESLRHTPAKVVAVVHGETSTGMLQPHMEKIGRICREHDALLVVDAVVTLGGLPVDVDHWRIDMCTSGTQKCLGCPSGMAPITYNARAENVLASRKKPVVSNYFDLSQLQRYWSPERLNHHTLPTSMTYGLREALRLVISEGLEARWTRHRRVGDALKAGLEAMGIKLFGDPDHRLPMITAMYVPEGIPDEAGRARLLQQFSIEIATSFGPLRGRIWRIGTMGYNAELNTVLRVLTGLEQVFRSFGLRIPQDAAVDAAEKAYAVTSGIRKAAIMISDPFVEFKKRQREGWAYFTPIEAYTTPAAAQLVRFAGVRPGQTVLDVGTGTGVVAITARRGGAVVTGLDLTPELLTRARENAALADVNDIVWREGDAEGLPFADGAFDVVLSQFGHMFAPRPDVATREMLRVLKPGGRLAFATWPPEHFVGKMFNLVGTYIQAPPGVAPPAEWGDPGVIRDRLESRVRDIDFERGVMMFPALSPQHYRDFIEKTAGPLINLVQSLQSDRTKLGAFRKELEALVAQYLVDNVVRQEYLLTRAIKA